MPRSFFRTLALATLSTAAVSIPAMATAQNATLAEPDSSAGSYSQTQAAPIERPAPGTARPQISTTQPANGVWLRSAPGSSVQTVSSDANGTELRVDHGVANVTVNHAAENAQILVDLPGGQTALTKDGLYTFNADTNTVRVLHGEADAFNTGSPDHRIKIKDEQQLVFGSNHAKDMTRADARADLLGGGFAGDGHSGYRGGYGYGPYGDGFYGGYSPYWASDYPYWGGWGPWGYPYGYGFGLGFYGGYYGGFRGGYGGFGGFRGGGGFRGR